MTLKTFIKKCLLIRRMSKIRKKITKFSYLFSEYNNNKDCEHLKEIYTLLRHLKYKLIEAESKEHDSVVNIIKSKK